MKGTSKRRRSKVEIEAQKREEQRLKEEAERRVVQVRELEEKLRSMKAEVE